MIKMLGQCLGLMLLVSLLLSCGRSPDSNFYSLSSAPGENFPQGRIAVGVGPITLADYLQQPPIATRITANQLKFDEYHRWAGPLKDNIANVLMSDLQGSLKSNRVYAYPSRENTGVHWQVVVRVNRFDTNSRGTSVLWTDWQLYRQPQNVLVLTRTSKITTRVQDALNYDSIVATMSHNLQILSQEIAHQLLLLH